jgi:predicted RNase H-like nuclease (RuvC/YqgF family)
VVRLIPASRLITCTRNINTKEKTMTDQIIELDGKLINCEQFDQLRQVTRKGNVEQELRRLRDQNNSLLRWIRRNRHKIGRYEQQLAQMRAIEQEIFEKM